jgi:hypothetical protein
MSLFDDFQESSEENVTRQEDEQDMNSPPPLKNIKVMKNVLNIK